MVTAGMFSNRFLLIFTRQGGPELEKRNRIKRKNRKEESMSMENMKVIANQKIFEYFPWCSLTKGQQR